MGKQRAAPPPNDNLTISRIHIVLRPFETKLNVLAKTLEKKIAEDKYAPKPRQPGITYAKRHRIRAMTGMTWQQAGRAYALEKSKGLSTLYSFHEQLIGVEDAFRNLVRGIPPLERSEQVERVPSLQAMVCKMIGRQVAEETLRDKEALEADGVEDCIGLWYGGLAVHCRKYALVSHAVQLVELKIPFFILELWKGLLSITMQAGLREESCILLEYILLYYFNPDDTSASDGACPAAHMAGRDLTDLYNQLTDLSVYSLAPGEFFATLLPIIEASPCAVAIWNFRCIHHFIRNLDGDIILTARIVDSMAKTWADSLAHGQGATEDAEKLAGAVESKTYGFLTVFATLGDTQDPEATSEEMVREVAHLAWTTNLVGKSRPSADLLGISLALDVVTVLLATKHSSLAGINLSDPVERLMNIGALQEDKEESKEEIYKALTKALHSAQPARLFAYQKQLAETSSPDSLIPSPTGEKRRLEPFSYLVECWNALRGHGLEELAETLERCHDEMVSRGDNMRLCIVPAPSGELKRRRMGNESHGGKRRKLQKDWKDGESVGDGESTSSESEAATEWNASVSEEDTAGEQQEDDEEEEDSEEESEEYTTVNTSRRPSNRDEDDDITTFPESQAMDDDEEEMEDESDAPEQPSYTKPSTPRQPKPSKRQTYKFGPLSLQDVKPRARSPGINQARLDNIRSINTTSTTRLATSTSGSRNANPSSQPVPVLRTVMISKMQMPSAMVASLARRTREEEREREREMMTSSDDDLDLLGAVERERAALAARQNGKGSGAGRRGSSSRGTGRWSTP